MVQFTEEGTLRFRDFRAEYEFIKKSSNLFRLELGWLFWTGRTGWASPLRSYGFELFIVEFNFLASLVEVYESIWMAEEPIR